MPYLVNQEKASKGIRPLPHPPSSFILTRKATTSLHTTLLSRTIWSVKQYKQEALWFYKVFIDGLSSFIAFWRYIEAWQPITIDDTSPTVG